MCSRRIKQGTLKEHCRPTYFGTDEVKRVSGCIMWNQCLLLTETSPGSFSKSDQQGGFFSSTPLKCQNNQAITWNLKPINIP